MLTQTTWSLRDSVHWGPGLPDLNKDGKYQFAPDRIRLKSDDPARPVWGVSDRGAEHAVIFCKLADQGKPMGDVVVKIRLKKLKGKQLQYLSMSKRSCKEIVENYTRGLHYL